MIAFLAFALPLTLFLSFPSTLWNFDGVACAAALELGQPAYFFHANHLLYGFFGFLFWKFIGLPIGMTRALPSLQLFTSLLSALGLIGLYRVLAAQLNNRLVALILSSSLAVTAAFWVWSVEAQVYPLAFLPLAWATFALVADKTRYKYVWVGLLHGAAVLGHMMHVLWIIPALYWIREENKSMHQPLRQYVGTFALITILPYLVVLEFVIVPGRDLHHVLVWLKGSAGLTPDRSFAWHQVGFSGPWIWLKSTLPSLWGSFWPYGKTTVSYGIGAATIVSMALVVALFVRGAFKAGPLGRFAFIWLGLYGLFLSTWEPATLCYRMTDIIPLGLLLALGLKSWKTPLQLLLVTGLLASTLTVNLATRINPMRQADQNPIYQEALTLSKITPENSLYVTGGGLTWIYILYFTGRTAWNAHAFGGEQLKDELVKQKQARPVYIESSLLRDPADSTWLQNQKLKQIEEGSPWLQIL